VTNALAWRRPEGWEGKELKIVHDLMSGKKIKVYFGRKNRFSDQHRLPYEEDATWKRISSPNVRPGRTTVGTRHANQGKI